MSKGMKSVDEMVDYVRQLRLHAKGRRAIRVKLSGLEKHFREEHYRRFVAMTLRPLIKKYDAVMFALPTNDVVLIAKDAKVDHIDPLLHHIRRKFRDSILIQSLDPMQGVSDDFVEWFDIGADYPAFRKYIEQLAEAIVSGAKGREKSAKQFVDNIPARRKPKLVVSEKILQPPRRKVRMVPIEPPERDLEPRELAPELIVALDKALVTADVTSMVRRQRVMAIAGQQAPEPVMEHKFVPRSVVLEKLLLADVQGEDRWMEGYLEELLARRLLLSAPAMAGVDTLAASLHISCAAVGEDGFKQFDKSLGAQSRSAIILEFSAADVVTNFGGYMQAHTKIDPLGYRVMIGDLDLRALLWLDYRNFDADFVKLSLPEGDEYAWLDSEMEDFLRRRIKEIGLARVILDGCDSQGDVDLGKRLGITLFQGEAVSPTTL